MAAWKCGWCGTLANMTPEGSGNIVARQAVRPESYGGKKHEADLFSRMVCSNCHARSIARAEFPISDNSSELKFSEHNQIEYWRHHVPDTWAPQWVEGQDFAYAPDRIGEVASEAYRCHSVGAHMAAILMARTAIEAAAKDKGITGKNLKAKIDSLAEDGYIRLSIQESAHQVRMFGNDMAHGDVQIEVTENDAKQVLKLLTFILQDLYEVHASMSEVGVALEGRKPEAAIEA